MKTEPVRFAGAEPVQGELLPGPSLDVYADEFAGLADPASIERLYTGCRWAEGPCYIAEMRCLLWSDIPTQRILRLDEMTGRVDVLHANTGHANGNTRDREGRLISCEQSGRRVVRYEPDGSLTVIADAYQGKRFNSPNDVVVKSDGTIWFSDPNFGNFSTFYSNGEAQEIATCNVYRVDPADGSVTVVVDDFTTPNGLAFSPDERRLYIAESSFLMDPKNGSAHLRAFDVRDDNTLAGGEILAEISPGIPDGFRLDTGGRLWVGAGDGVHCITPEGDLLGKILIPETVANVTFGGPRRNRLYIAATTSIYATYVSVSGLQRP